MICYAIASLLLSCIAYTVYLAVKLSVRVWSELG